MNQISDEGRLDNAPSSEMHASRARSVLGAIARFLLLVMIGSVAVGSGAIFQGYLYFTKNLPSVDKLKNYSPPIVSCFYGSRGELIAEFCHQRRFVVPIEEIPDLLQQAFITAEDRRFFVHGAFDKEAFIRSIKWNLTFGRIQGCGSTITQQVAKNFQLTPEKKFTRKLKEAILSVQIEGSLSKTQILYLYLNQIYLGSGAYGVEAAARAYFDKHVKDLTVAECAMLGGLAKAPTRSSPLRNLQRALDRRAYVLKGMLKEGYITQEQYEEALKEEPKLVHKQPPHAGVAADFVEHVRKYVEQKYGSDALLKEGLQVYTTIDLNLTKAGIAAVDEGLRELDKRQGYRGPVKTLTAQGVMDFLEEKTKSMGEPLKSGDITDGVITEIDNENIYVRMGSYVTGATKREYVGQIKIDPKREWWCRRPYMRPEKRTRNLVAGDLPFQVGDLIMVRLVGPLVDSSEQSRNRYGKTDRDMKNNQEGPEDAVTRLHVKPEQQPLVQAALMLRENRSGHVKVLIGGHGGSDSKYNRATQARRHAGSSFQPVIYAAALNKGFTCTDLIADAPVASTMPCAGQADPGGYASSVTFRDALVHGKTVPMNEILQRIGLDEVRSYAHKLGYTAPLADNPTMGLDSIEVSLEEHVNAFSVFPNKGFAVQGVYVTKIVDRNGCVLEEHNPPDSLDDSVQLDKPRIQPVSQTGSTSNQSGAETTVGRGTRTASRIFEEKTAQVMTDLLRGVVQEGTATILKETVGRPDIAGQTGTTHGHTDAWVVGFSPDYTAGVWVGFDDSATMGEGVTGGTAAAPIWGAFMKKVLKDYIEAH